MAFRVRTVRDLGEYRAALGSIGHYFGWIPSEEDAERFSRLLPLERMHAVLDGGAVVAGAGIFPFELTIPGGTVPCAGVTVVGVLPSHRRRGLLRRLMNAQLEDMQARNEPVAALWASEETIYGRFGFGLASLNLLLTADRRAGMRAGLPAREGGIRLVEQDEALRTLPRLYERVRRTTPGFLSRSRDWWELRLLDDRPERRRGAGPLNRAVLELDGRPSGYALYRIAQKGSGLDWSKTVRVVEAVGVDARATREIWRFLFEIDWTDSVEYWHLPVDHPLRLLAGRVNLLRATVADALWVRLVDLPAALAARTYAREGTVTVEVVSDPLVPANVGIWSVGEGAARRSRRRPDVRLSVQALGSVYLGGFSLRELAAAELVEEGTRGGLAKADELFRTQAAPWCPEIF